MDGPNSQKPDSLGVLVPNFFGSRHAYGFGNALPTSKAPPGPPWVRTVLKTEDWVITCRFIVKHGESWDSIWITYIQNMSKYGDSACTGFIASYSHQSWWLKFWVWILRSNWLPDCQGRYAQRSAKHCRCGHLGMFFVKSKDTRTNTSWRLQVAWWYNINDIQLFSANRSQKRPYKVVPLCAPRIYGT